MDPSLTLALARARDGDADALVEVVVGIQDGIYRLAFHMLGHPEDAQDATQDILVKVVTHLSTFAEESRFTTWVYRIAVNHLLTTRTRRREQHATFVQLGETIARGMAVGHAESADQPEDALLVAEVQRHCTQGMLLCLDRAHRIAFILDTIFEVTSPEGSAILQITPAAYRQRLARARHTLRAFLAGHCGIVNPANPCRCRRQVAPSMHAGSLDPNHLCYVTATEAEADPARSSAALHAEFVALEEMATLFRRHPAYQAPEVFVQMVRTLVTTQPLRLLEA